MTVTIVFLALAVFGATAAPEFYNEHQQQWQYWRQHELAPPQVKQNPNLVQPHNSNGLKVAAQFQQWPQWQENSPVQFQREVVNAYNEPEHRFGVQQQQPWGQWELTPPKQPAQQQPPPQKPHIVIPSDSWQQAAPPQKPQKPVPNLNIMPETNSDVQRQPWGQWELEPPKQIPQQKPQPQKPYYASPNENKSPEVNAEFQQWLQQQQYRESEKLKPQQNLPLQNTKPQREPAPQRQKPNPQKPQNFESMENEYVEGPLRFQKDPRCPRADNPRKPVHLPIAGDCTKFMKCVEGLAFEQDCPAGLEFGVGVNRCDYPKNAKCSTN
ncbi:hypothetical protein RP20_CCG015588 [Aedes albopictus]|nr:gamma-gliadin-like [Aedes albopictus]KXJ73544.1 hypothetical protein RP20_CCG015588 [Aedes albopictus]